MGVLSVAAAAGDIAAGVGGSSVDVPAGVLTLGSSLTPGDLPGEVVQRSPSWSVLNGVRRGG